MQSVHSPAVSGPQRSFIQPGYHQNLSGSDTDVSTSTENLTAEEKRVLQNGVRQEPQGEETIADDTDAISSNTLIIHDTKIAGEHDSPFYSQNFKLKNSESPIQALGREKKDSYNRLYSEFSENANMHPNTRIINSKNVPLSPKTSLHKVMYPTLQKSPNHNSWEHYSSPNEFTRQNVHSNLPAYSTSGSYHLMPVLHSFPESHSTQGITEIPKDYLDQSEVLKHLAKELNHQNFHSDPNYPPLPEYPKQAIDNNNQIIFGSPARRRGLGMNAKSKSVERLSVSRSHPDLCHGKLYHSEDNSAISHYLRRFVYFILFMFRGFQIFYSEDYIGYI
jgi:angiomotin like 1